MKQKFLTNINVPLLLFLKNIGKFVSLVIDLSSFLRPVHQVFGATSLLVAFDGNLNFSLIHTQVMSTLKPDSNDQLPN